MAKFRVTARFLTHLRGSFGCFGTIRRVAEDEFAGGFHMPLLKVRKRSGQRVNDDDKQNLRRGSKAKQKSLPHRQGQFFSDVSTTAGFLYTPIKNDVKSRKRKIALSEYVQTFDGCAFVP